MLALIERQHIKPVRRDIMGRRSEGRDPEDDQRQDEKGYRGMSRRDNICRGVRKGQGRSDKSRTDQHLHGQDPPSLGLDNIDERTPEGFNHPREIQDTGIRGDIGVRHAHLLEHDRRDRVHNEIGNSFREIKGRNPKPGRDF